MEILKEIGVHPERGFVLLVFLLLAGIIVAGLVWAVLAAVRWSTKGRDVKAFGVELKDEEGECQGEDCGGYKGPDRRVTTMAELLKAMKGGFFIAEKISKSERLIQADQKSAVSTRRAAFYAAMEAVSVPSIFARLFLVEFEDVLQLAAEYNHIAAKVDFERRWIEPSYLASKVRALEVRYRSTAAVLTSGIEWPPIESHLCPVVQEVLFDFHAIATKRKADLAGEIRQIKDNLGVSDAMATFLDELAQEVA